MILRNSLFIPPVFTRDASLWILLLLNFLHGSLSLEKKCRHTNIFMDLNLATSFVHSQTIDEHSVEQKNLQSTESDGFLRVYNLYQSSSHSLTLVLNCIFEQDASDSEKYDVLPLNFEVRMEFNTSSMSQRRDAEHDATGESVPTLRMKTYFHFADRQQKDSLTLKFTRSRTSDPTFFSALIPFQQATLISTVEIFLMDCPECLHGTLILFLRARSMQIRSLDSVPTEPIHPEENSKNESNIPVIVTPPDGAEKQQPALPNVNHEILINFLHTLCSRYEALKGWSKEKEKDELKRLGWILLRSDKHEVMKPGIVQWVYSEARQQHLPEFTLLHPGADILNFTPSLLDLSAHDSVYRINISLRVKFYSDVILNLCTAYQVEGYHDHKAFEHCVGIGSRHFFFRSESPKFTSRASLRKRDSIADLPVLILGLQKKTFYVNFPIFFSQRELPMGSASTMGSQSSIDSLSSTGPESRMGYPSIRNLRISMRIQSKSNSKMLIMLTAMELLKFAPAKKLSDLPLLAHTP